MVETEMDRILLTILEMKEYCLSTFEFHVLTAESIDACDFTFTKTQLVFIFGYTSSQYEFNNFFNYFIFLTSLCHPLIYFNNPPFYYRRNSSLHSVMILDSIPATFSLVFSPLLDSHLLSWCEKPEKTRRLDAMQRDRAIWELSYRCFNSQTLSV